MAARPVSNTLNISLPDTLRSFVDDKVKEGGYSSASEYVRELPRAAQEKEAAREKVEALLLKGLNSPKSDMTAEDWSAPPS